MSNEIKELLEERVKSEINGLKSLSLDTKEKKEAIANLTTIHRLYIEESKLEAELKDKQERLDMDNRKIEIDDINHVNEETLKRDQMKEQAKDRYFKLAVAGAEIVIPIIFYSVWMYKGFKFEETQTFTSTTFKGLFNRFRPTKK